MKSSRLSLLLVVLQMCSPFVRSTLAADPSPTSISGKSIFVPFDFYPRHREELGLNDEQLRELQRLADQMRDSAQSIETERRERTKALQEALTDTPIDPKKANALFEELLKSENELKALQFHNGITMRNLLTPEQAAKLEPIAAKEKASGIAATSGVLDEKLQQLRAEIRKRAQGGEPSREVVAKVEQIEQAARQGRVTEARTQIDEMLRDLRSGALSGSNTDSKSLASPPPTARP